MKIIIRGNYDRDKEAVMYSRDGQTLTVAQVRRAVRRAGLSDGDYPRWANRPEGDMSDGIPVYDAAGRYIIRVIG